MNDGRRWECPSCGEVYKVCPPGREVDCQSCTGPVEPPAAPEEDRTVPPPGWTTDFTNGAVRRMWSCDFVTEGFPHVSEAAAIAACWRDHDAITAPLRAELGAVKRDRNEWRDFAKDARTELAAARARVAELEELVAQHQKAAAFAQDRFAEEQDERDAARKDFEAMGENARCLARERDAAIARAEAADSRVAELEAALEQAVADRYEARLALNGALVDRDNAGENARREKKRAQAACEERDAAIARAEDLARQLAALTERCGPLCASEMQELRKHAEAAEAQLATVTRGYDRVSRERDDWKSQCGDETRAHHEARLALSSWQRSHDSACSHANDLAEHLSIAVANLSTETARAEAAELARDQATERWNDKDAECRRLEKATDLVLSAVLIDLGAANVRVKGPVDAYDTLERLLAQCEPVVAAAQEAATGITEGAPLRTLLAAIRAQLGPRGKTP